MLHFDSVEACRAQARAWRRGGSLGFVPTMGALHAGHVSLVKAARARCEHVIASVFVNPTQFAPGEDLDQYPRDFEGDCAKLAAAGCDAVFTTTPKEMYPEGFATWVDVSGTLTAGLCGASREGHFRGVTTVVLKLLNIVGPSDAFFGEKDRQQLIVLDRMVRDLNVPVTVHGCPIVREPDGLALSSRNAYLDADQRARALALSAGLRAAQAAFAQGERDPRALEECVRALLTEFAVEEDYVRAVDPESLADASQARGATILAVAARLGKTRLIDNCVLDQPLPPARPSEVVERAPAKTNLFLEVPRKRADGFHELETVFVELGLADELRFAEADALSLTIEGDDALAADPSNLVWRAADLLRTRAGRPDLGAAITLSKRVPQGGGLGGGSSDAAAALRGLNRLWGLGLSLNELHPLAAELGSDTAFFLRGGWQLGSGRGEVLAPLAAPAEPLPLVLLLPDFGCPTPQVYGALAPFLPGTPRKALSLVNALAEGPRAVAAQVFNRLEEPAFACFPKLQALRAELAKAPGVLATLLSGSGSTLVGLCETADDAQAAAASLVERGLRALATHAGPAA